MGFTYEQLRVVLFGHCSQCIYYVVDRLIPEQSPGKHLVRIPEFKRIFTSPCFVFGATGFTITEIVLRHLGALINLVLTPKVQWQYNIAETDIIKVKAIDIPFGKDFFSFIFQERNHLRLGGAKPPVVPDIRRVGGAGFSIS